MDKKMPASRFRLDFTKIKEPVEVTVHGRTIGSYTPRTEEDLPISRGRVKPEDISHQ